MRTAYTPRHGHRPKRRPGILVGALILIVLSGAVAAFTLVQAAPDTESATTSAQEPVAADSGNRVDTAEQITDQKMAEFIHCMSHQYVQAAEKWCFIENTPARVDHLLALLDDTSLEHGDTWRTILTRWDQGNFTLADADHNAAWNVLGGTVGRATGLLTPKEVDAYLAAHNAN